MSGAPEPAPQKDPVEVVREMALRSLDRRSYGIAELKAKLLSKGADEAVVDDVLSRLTRVGLLDDAKYAADLVAERHGVRHQSRQATVLEMKRRGLDADVIDEATSTIDADDDLEGARRIVAQRLPRLVGLDRTVIWRRLSGALARRGYGPAVVSTVVREAIQDVSSDVHGL